MTIAAVHPTIALASGATFAYRTVEHPSGMVLVFASSAGQPEREVARFVPNGDGTVTFTDASEPLLNDPRLEGGAWELAVSYAEHLAETDDLRFAF